MSFLSPKAPAPPPVPPPSPPPAIQPAPAEKSSESYKTKERMRRKRGVSSTILTGPRGLMPEQMPTNTPHLLGTVIGDE
jgi:hypothetical protein